MGGGVGLGALGVTHGLGPEAAAPPPPPPPSATATNADEREAIWERKRQAMRDAAAPPVWHNRHQIFEAWQRVRREALRTEHAKAERERLRVSDLLYRYGIAAPYTTVWPQEPSATQSTGTFLTAGEPSAAQAVASDVVAEVRNAPSLDDAEVSAELAADHAVLSFGDEAALRAFADGTLEITADPRLGLTAKLTTDDGQQFIYPGMGKTAKRQVRMGETIGFTPASSRTRKDLGPAQPTQPTDAPRVVGELPSPKPWPSYDDDVMRWRESANAPAVRAARVAAPPPAPARRAPSVLPQRPLPPERDRGGGKAIAALAVLGALLLGAKR